MVVLPAPVCPTMAAVSPGSTAKLTSFSTQSGSPALGLSSPSAFLSGTVR